MSIVKCEQKHNNEIESHKTNFAFSSKQRGLGTHLVLDADRPKQWHRVMLKQTVPTL